MKVRVELKQYLDQYAPDDNPRFDYELDDGATVHDLIRHLHIPGELATVISIGDEAGTPDTVLKEGDRVTIIPPIGGG